jgi:N-acetylmuramoyl-L-alanine amidase
MKNNIRIYLYFFLCFFMVTAQAAVHHSIKKTSAFAQTKKIVVVIDPGHGGHDPGAVGIYGTQEKRIVLAIAKQLAVLINKQPNMHALLTRNRDHYVSLWTRLKTARKGKADIYISIHADSYFNNAAKGISVYALSKNGATTLAARWLAVRENHSELGDVNLGKLEDQSKQLRSVLIDMAQTATRKESLRLGRSVLDSLQEATKLRYTRIEQAPFMVLKSPDIPSILVEVGFLSNPTEEKKLSSPEYQQQLAQALFLGVKNYIKKYASNG